MLTVINSLLMSNITSYVLSFVSELPSRPALLKYLGPSFPLSVSPVIADWTQPFSCFLITVISQSN